MREPETESSAAPDLHTDARQARDAAYAFARWREGRAVEDLPSFMDEVRAVLIEMRGRVSALEAGEWTDRENPLEDVPDAGPREWSRHVERCRNFLLDEPHFPLSKLIRTRADAATAFDFVLAYAPTEAAEEWSLVRSAAQREP